MKLKVPPGLTDTLPGSGSVSREELRERDIFTAEDEERMYEQHFEGFTNVGLSMSSDCMDRLLNPS